MNSVVNHGHTVKKSTVHFNFLKFEIKIKLFEEVHPKEPSDDPGFEVFED
jgi:hypothetical protein